MIYGNKFINEALLETSYFVNEAYFGKTEALLEAENAIHNLREKYDPKLSWVGTPEVKAIEDAFKKQFGMDYFSLNIVPQTTVNAFTYPIGSRFDVIKYKQLSKLVEADKNNGFRFKPNNGFVIVTCIYAGLLMMPSVSDAEIVAILLHEIGHNFADIVSDDIRLANEEYYELVVLYIIINALANFFLTLPKDIKNAIENSNKYQRNKKEKEKTKGKLFSFIDYMFASTKDASNKILLFTSRIFYGIIGGLFGIDRTKDRSKSSYRNDIKTSAGRQNEVIADKFAAIYGYGAEIASALSKVDLTRHPADEVLEKLPFGKLILIQNAKLSQDYFKDDPHPHLIQRINTMISALEFELQKKDVDPKMKKIIKQQIKDLEDIKSAFETIDADDDEVNKIIKTYAVLVDEKFPEATTDKLEKEINKTIDDICNKKKKIK